MATPFLTRSEGRVGSPATGAVGPRRRQLLALAADVAPGAFAIPAAGTQWRIGRGGGFWCNPAAGLMTQRGTPAQATELRTNSPVDGLRGLLRLRLTVGHAFRVAEGTDLKPRLAVIVKRQSVARYRVSVRADGTSRATSVPVGATVSCA